MNLLRDLFSGLQAAKTEGYKIAQAPIAMAQGLNRATPWGQANQRAYNATVDQRQKQQQPLAVPQNLSFPGYIDPNQQMDPTVPGVMRQYYEHAKYL